jgi:hypothetical protein
MSMKRMAACLAATASLALAAAGPASAERYPEGPGQPGLSGAIFEGHGVIHCQALTELFSGEELAPGTIPAGVVTLPSGRRISTTPEGKATCLFQ